MELMEVYHETMATWIIGVCCDFVVEPKIGVDDWKFTIVLTTQGFGQKALSRCCIAFSRE